MAGKKHACVCDGCGVKSDGFLVGSWIQPPTGWLFIVGAGMAFEYACSVKCAKASDKKHANDTPEGDSFFEGGIESLASLMADNGNRNPVKA